MKLTLVGFGTMVYNRDCFEKALVNNLRTALGPGAKVHWRRGRLVCQPAEGTPLEEACTQLGWIPGVAHLAPVTLADRDLYAITRAAYLSNVRQEGPGGLPVGTSGRYGGRLVVREHRQFGGGYLMMKRGCRVVFGHVRNENQHSGDVEGKIQALVRQLTGYQLRSRLYVLPFDDLQRQSINFVLSRRRMIVYRRFMNRLLTRVAQREDAKAVVTGDSVGQVASQTLDNLECIRDAAGMTVLSPLIGMNKEEIVALACKVGTYEESIQPYPDCCSFMVAAHPETRADPDLVRRCEANLEEAEQRIEACLEAARVEEFAL